MEALRIPLSNGMVAVPFTGECAPTDDLAGELAAQESVIESGLSSSFKDVGRALNTIRQNKLYRLTFATFASYCRERWSLSKTRAYELIELCEDGSRLSAKADESIPSFQEPLSDDCEAVQGDVAESLAAKSGRKFGCVYADPPWQYGNQSTRASTDNHYDTMTIADLKALPVASVVADDAHLHLWTTNAFLRDSFDVIEAWGFEYRSVFVWVKPQMGIGNYWRVSHEFLLTAIRGDSKRFNDRSLMSWLQADRTKHSAKPEAVRGFIERASPGPYLELFGRKPVGGWTVLGNQIDARLFS